MKYLLMLTILAAVIFSIGGCASTDTTAKTGGPVPGEAKSAEESRLQPGAGMGPNASVKW